jgi:hypothetical protein
MMHPLTIIIVEKLGNLKTLGIKDYKEDDLFKKCGFKTNVGFQKQVEWKVKLNNISYYIQVYGKSEGRANNENKYDFPPPIDTKILFGNCAVVCNIKNNVNEKEYINITIDLWETIYEKLFGGFEDLNKLINEDDKEEDELLKIPNKYKTKIGGYLKDGFVVDEYETNEYEEDSSDNITEIISNDEDEDEDEDIDIIIKQKNKKSTATKLKQTPEPTDLDIGSELSEDAYDL